MAGDGRVTDERLILLDERDNVLVLREPLRAGARLAVDGHEIALARDLPLGHKIARSDIGVGERIMKYGAPIGRATAPIPRGGHVHVHNVASEYIPTYHLDGVPGRDRGG